MYLSHLSLTNFRNFRQLDLDLPPGVVVLFGKNAQGKTSILEAVFLLAIARSFRADSEHEVVNWDATGEDGDSLVAGTIEKQEERLRVNIGYTCVPVATGLESPFREPSPYRAEAKRDRPFGVRRQIRVSRVKRTAAELVGLVNVVLFSAEDLQLVQGPPSLRRRYLDILISQGDQSYLRALQRYQRVLHQRNKLLKLLQESRAHQDELSFWDGELLKEGSWIVGRRYEAIGVLAGLCRERHSELTGADEELTIEYRPSVAADRGEIQERFAEALEASKKHERGVGSTVVGPHRDDLALFVNGADMSTYASRGQARTLALTLRLAEAAYLASIRDEGPVVLLDDVLSEMDSLRRGRILQKATQYQQVIITTTDLESVERSLLGDATYFEVEGGRVSRVERPTDSVQPGSPLSVRLTPGAN